MAAVCECEELFLVLYILHHYRFSLHPFSFVLDVRLRKLAGEKEELLSQVKTFFSLEGDVSCN